jgi:hypothetical protein
VSREGVHIDPKKATAEVVYAPPNDLKALKYFMPNFDDIAAPLNNQNVNRPLTS